MKKVLVSMLCVVAMICLLSGCANEADKLVGDWVTEIDMTDIMNESVAELDMGEDDAFSDFVFALNLSFNEDGTYKMEVDVDKMEEMIETAQEELEALLVKYFEKLISDQKSNMTVDEVLKLSGTSLDTIIAEFGLEDTCKEMAEEVFSEGAYDAKDGKLFTSDEKESDIDEEEYELYTLDGDVLTITGCYPEMEVEDDIMDYPIVFKKKD